MEDSLSNLSANELLRSRSFLQDFHIYSIVIGCLVPNHLWNIYHILCKILDILGDKKK